MYTRRNMGVIVLTHSSTFHMPSLFTQIHSNSLKNLYKIQINSNKLEQAVNKVS